MSFPITASQVTIFGGPEYLAGRQRSINVSLLKAVSSIAKNVGTSNLSLVPSNSTGAPVTIVGYTPSNFSGGTAALGSFFFSLSPNGAAGNTGTAGNTGILTLPAGAKICGVQLMATAAMSGATGINIGYQSTASNAVAASNTQILAASTALFGSSTNYLNMVPSGVIGGALSATNVGGNPLSTGQTLNVTSFGTTPFATGGLQIAVSYYL